MRFDFDLILLKFNAPTATTNCALKKLLAKCLSDCLLRCCWPSRRCRCPRRLRGAVVPLSLLCLASSGQLSAKATLGVEPVAATDVDAWKLCLQLCPRSWCCTALWLSFDWAELHQLSEFLSLSLSVPLFLSLSALIYDVVLVLLAFISFAHCCAY